MKGNNKKPIQPLHVRGRSENSDNFMWRFGTLEQELRQLFHVRIKPSVIAKFLVLTVGILLTPISICGLLAGFNFAYLKFMYPKDELPRLHTLPRIVKIAMGLGVLIAWVLSFLIFVMLVTFFGSDLTSLYAILTYLTINSVISVMAYVIWRKWRIGIANMLLVADAHGSAHWATQEDMKDYLDTPGLYLGGQYRMNHKGHVALFGNPRSGKNVYALINAILGVGGYKSSWCILDPKGELACICGPALKRMGKRVVVINPFKLLPDYIKECNSYNPLDFVGSKSDDTIVDDLATLAEGIVPKVANDRNSFFTSAGRNLISIILLYLICTAKDKKPTLTDLWATLRLTPDEWESFILEMSQSEDPVHGEAIRRGAAEILRNMGAEEMWSSIISTALEATNIFQSKNMQEALQSGLDPYSLAIDTNTVVFITVPAQALTSHSAYLRTVISSILQAIMKKPGERFTLLADEAAALDYMSIIENSLAVGAGFNLTLFLVYQSIAQLKGIFRDRWESVMSNIYCKLYLSQRDNTSLKYIVEGLGTKTHVIYKRDFWGNISDAQHQARPLATVDELRQIFKTQFLLSTGDNPPALIEKVPYWQNPALHINNKPIYDENPYIENSK